MGRNIKTVMESRLNGGIVMIVNVSDKLNQIETLKDLIKLTDKYDVLMIDKNLIVGESGNHSMYVMYSRNKCQYR